MDETVKQIEKAALVIDPEDNVAVLLQDIAKGETCSIRMGDQTKTITVKENIAFGHKVAIQPLGKNESVLKYGEEIGKMEEPIEIGGWIHNHNMYCERGMK